MSLIEIKNVTKRFDDKIAVDNISLSIEDGDIFGLLGPNGAGKSTLISMITGLLKPDSGDILVDGYSIIKNPLEVKRQLGLVPQEIALMETVSAYDNLEFWGSLYGLKGKLLKERINEALEVAGLMDRKNEKLKKFSGGMKRRLNIAAAILHHPRILIMDEPTVGIDPQSRNHIFEFTKEINKNRNTTVIYTSHYMEEVDYLCNGLFIMDLGKEVAYGTKKSVKAMVSDKSRLLLKPDSYTAETLIRVKALEGVMDLTEEDGMLKLVVKEEFFNLNTLINSLYEEKIKIRGITFEEPTLEEVFLSLTGKTLRD
ncbi:ABC transporter ATP-binding protein [Clostridium tunisiense]|uniref:ABC transporter ATP-binding protein n=1 Tax=Clostridium tunisiense TaxID=219748 RepID=UPI000313FB73|nr:ABC transporter ATP-binding protein [Clostridium tunisiense]